MIETIQFLTYNESVGIIVGGKNSQKFISQKEKEKTLSKNLVLIIKNNAMIFPDGFTVFG
jgi:hypothetical protein